jgi:hypothetical protein
LEWILPANILDLLDPLEPTYLVSQFRKHGISMAEVQTILRNGVGVNRKDFEDTEPSEHGNDKTMLVGFSRPNRLIEVGIEWEAYEGQIYGAVVHHAMPATEPYKRDYFTEIT